MCLHNLKNTSTRNIISLIRYSNGAYSYILSSYGFGPGMFTKFIKLNNLFSSYSYSSGSVVFLKNLTVGSIFFNVGSSVLKFNNCNVQLPSGLVKTINSNITVTLGRNNNIWKYKEIVGKAGRNIQLGYKSSVRGVAMNPVDHPHGGRTKTNSPERTPWGKIAKFKK